MNQPRFNLKNKLEKETLILLICRFKGERFLFSTGMKVSPKQWNDRTMRVRSNQEYIDHIHINQGLDTLQAAATKLLQKHASERSALTQMSFKDELEAILSGGHGRKGQTDFLAFFNQLIDERKQSPKYSSGSIEVYENARNHMKRYAKGKKLHFQDLTVSFLKGFVTYLFKEDFMDNHINKIIGTIRMVLNEATELRLNSLMDYKSRKISVPKTETDNVYLTITDLGKLSELDLSSKPGKEKVRDLFLIAAYTGLRYSDFSKLRREYIQEVEGKRFFNILLEKTETRVWIPIHPIVETILAKYAYNLPQAISNQKTNDHLKLICKEAGLSDVFTKRVYRGGILQEEVYEKWEMVSTHTGRRSFATNAYIAGVPIANIMRITGHKKVETFLKYIKFDNLESAFIVSAHPFFAA